MERKPDGDWAPIELFFERMVANDPVPAGQGESIGEQVVVVIDDQFVLKTLGRDEQGYCLLPANPDYPVIRPNSKLEILGAAVGLVRRYT